MNYETLFSPMKIGPVEMKNRVVMAPMLMGLGSFDGAPTKEMTEYYEERAKGGAGLIITEVTRVNDVTGATSFSQLAMSRDSHIAPMREFIGRLHSHGAKVFIQLHHPGRQNMGLLIGTVPLSIFMDKHFGFYKKLLYKIVPAGRKLMKRHLVPRVVAPSKCDNSYFADSVNRTLRKSEIQKLVRQFIQAASRAQKAGADGVELHASHGYLLQQFLSPNTNKRTDEYGGSLDNRMRFITEILKGIKSECGAKFPVIVRLTVDECYEKIGLPGKGYGLDEGVLIARKLEEAGADAIDVSSASYDTFNYWLEPESFECGWRAYMAEAVKKAVSVPVIAANLIRSPEQAEQQLKAGIQDFVSLGRPLLADPRWAEKAAEGNEKSIRRCICCLYCIESMQNNAYIGSHDKCSVNPLIGREALKLKANGAGRTVVVAGAGPAGLAAAGLLAERGFHTVVFEQYGEPGGQLLLTKNIPYKDKIRWCVEDLYHAAVSAGAEFHFHRKADANGITGFEPYAVFVAAGGTAAIPGCVEGIRLPHVLTAEQVLSGQTIPANKKIFVIGSGMTGLETAEMLAGKNNEVTVVEMAETAAPGTWMQHIDDIKPRLLKRGVKILTSKKLAAVLPDRIVLEDTPVKNSKSELPCDIVVLATGIRSIDELYEPLKKNCRRVWLIGDARRPGRIADAVEDAYNAVVSLD